MIISFNDVGKFTISPLEFMEANFPAVTEAAVFNGILLLRVVGDDEIVPKDITPEPFVFNT
jgi:hypothetical protein